MLSDCDAALVDLLHLLDVGGYAFVPPSSETMHGGRVRRTIAGRATLPDLFGWNRSLPASAIPHDILTLMRRGGIARSTAFGRIRSGLRVARVGQHLLYHSPFPVRGDDAVFLGPDSYRFIHFLHETIDLVQPGARLVDLGCGAGAGAIAVAGLRPDLQLVLADINPAALRLARINLAAAGLPGEIVESDGLQQVAGAIDAVITNPPFLGGRIGGRYRNGGDMLGAALSLTWLRSALARLSRDGVLLMYTATAIMDGEDRLRTIAERDMQEASYVGIYREVEGDLFSGMLWRPSYWAVDRIAAVTLSARRATERRVRSLTDRNG